LAASIVTKTTYKNSADESEIQTGSACPGLVFFCTWRRIRRAYDEVELN